MNSIKESKQMSQKISSDDEEIDLLELFEQILSGKKIILSALAIALILGTIYAFTAIPIYKANTLIQKKDAKGSGNSAMLAALMGSGAGGLLGVGGGSVGDMEMLHSRKIIGQTVDTLQLNLHIESTSSSWFGTPQKELSFERNGKFQTAEDFVDVVEFEIPKILENEQFIIKKHNDGFTLIAPDGQELGQGLLHKALHFTYQGSEGRILVDGITESNSGFSLKKTSRLQTIKSLQSAMNFSNKGKSANMLDLTLEGKNPSKIAKILDTTANFFIVEDKQHNMSEAGKKLAFLDAQLPKIRQELMVSETKFNQFRNKVGTFRLDKESEAALGYASALKIQQIQLQQQKQALQTQFTNNHPRTQAVNAQLQQVQRELDKLDTQKQKLPTVEQEMLDLAREVKINTEIYALLSKEYQQLRITKEGQIDTSRIVDMAQIAEHPIKPKKSLILVISALLGAFLGTVIVLAKYFFNKSIKDITEIERILSTAIWANIPLSAAQKSLHNKTEQLNQKIPLLALSNPNDPAIEALRSLRTSLQFAVSEAKNNLVLIGSAAPNTGKTFVSSNLAAIIAATGHDKKTLLIDADMRQGYLHQIFGKPRQNGLSEMLLAKDEQAKYIHTSVLPNLDFISTGTLPTNPSDLLAGKMELLLNQLQPNYHMVVVNTPPVLAASDASVIASIAGTVILTIRENMSTAGDIQETIRRLENAGAHVSGIVYNGQDLSQRKFRASYSTYAYASNTP